MPDQDKPTRRESDLQLALLIQSVETIKQQNVDGHEILFKKLECLETKLSGKNGTPGILTRMALAENNITRLWWWVGSVSIAIMGATVYIIRDHINLMG